MGSQSDWQTMRKASEILEELLIPHEIRIVSAHRTPKRMAEYADTARARGLKIIIAGAGGSAHLPGMIAAQTSLPVLGVPIESKALNGIDSLLSIVQMPRGVPVATVAIDNAQNAGILAARILSIKDTALETRLLSLVKENEKKVRLANQKLSKKFGAEVIFSRPKKLSTNYVPKLNAIKHAVMKSEKHYKKKLISGTLITKGKIFKLINTKIF